MIQEIIHQNLEMEKKIYLIIKLHHHQIVKKRFFCLFKYRLFLCFLDNDPKQQEQQPPITPPINPRVLIAVFLLSLVLTYITSSREKQRETDGLTHGGYISWNEFVQDMLSKGEVR